MRGGFCWDRSGQSAESADRRSASLTLIAVKRAGSTPSYRDTAIISPSSRAYYSQSVAANHERFKYGKCNLERKSEKNKLRFPFMFWAFRVECCAVPRATYAFSNKKTGFVTDVIITAAPTCRTGPPRIRDTSVLGTTVEELAHLRKVAMTSNRQR